MPEDDYPPAEQDNLLGVKYSKPPLPFRHPPGYELPTFYEKQDIENERRLQDIQTRNKQITVDVVKGYSHMDRAERLFDICAYGLSERADAVMKEKAKGTLWERLSFATQITLVGLVSLQVFRGGKWVVEWVWEKMNEVEEEQRRRQQLRLQQAGKRKHARDVWIRNERIIED